MQRGDPSAARVARDQVGEGGGAPEAADLRLGDRGLELLPDQDVRQVEQRAGGGGDRDARFGGQFVGRERRAVRGDVGPAQPARDGDIGPSRETPDGPQRAGRAMAQHCPLTAGEHRRHPRSGRRPEDVPDGVDARVNGMELAPGNAVVDGGSRRRERRAVRG
jgi:hypothetical protein